MNCKGIMNIYEPAACPKPRFRLLDSKLWLPQLLLLLLLLGPPALVLGWIWEYFQTNFMCPLDWEDISGLKKPTTSGSVFLLG